MMHLFDQKFEKAVLIIKFLKNELTDTEQAELDQWLAESEKNRFLFNELTSEKNIQEELLLLEQFPADADWQKLASKTIHKKSSAAVIGRMPQRWYYAAAVLIMVVVSTYVLMQKQDNKQERVITEIEKAKSITPGTNKAVITTADGRVIAITDTTQGVLSKEENVNLIVRNGEVSYQPVGENDKEQFNTITTPKGGQYRLLLSDGTKVWLNAASSLKYPIVFTGNERKVELQGEGYFEVAHQSSHPFKVLIQGKGEVEDIGTAFNINAYSNESFIKTTLLEGKVKVSSGAKSLLLNPKQQARIGAVGQIIMDDAVDTEEAIAWKNGRFVFKSVTLEHIMKQIERWYDIDVVYKSKISEERFSAIISRSGNLSEVLKMMSDAGVKFTLEGKTVVIY